MKPLASAKVAGAIASALISSSAFATSVFINEFHYDNDGGDVDEFIEIVAPEGTDLTDYSVVLYNGNNGAAYLTETLSGTVASLGDGMGSYVINLPTNGIQNGAPDGLALVDSNGQLIQFLSYEGSFTAVGGAADGITSVDIGIEETASTEIGMSLQLTGEGSEYDDFTWHANNQTPGAANQGQTFNFTVTPFINEIHYDNDGGDINELVEIAGSANTDLSGYTLVFYNGNGGSDYATESLSGVIPNLNDSGFGVLAFEKSGIQNGSPDGIALVGPDGTVIQFLSYEGELTATSGAANGLTSIDIGVSETTSTEVGLSLQLGGEGRQYSDFTWNAPASATAGAVNLTQVFGTSSDTDDGDSGSDDDGNDAPGIIPEGMFINEFHYDNDGGDENEFVEIAGPAGADLSTVSLVLYNGNGGTSYKTVTFTGTLPDEGNGYGTAAMLVSGIQNGAPDGLALVVDGDVVEFLSYEGVMTATNGPASGLTSTDILVSETGTALSTQSLQRVGEGNQRCSFIFAGPADASMGSINAGQLFTQEDDAQCSDIDDGSDDNQDDLVIGLCGDSATLISDVQGDSFVTPLNGQRVVIEAAVTAVLDGGSFFVQEEPSDQDSNPLTSEGIAVYAPDVSVSTGQIVRLLGTAEEYYEQTQLSDIEANLACGSNTTLATSMWLPVENALAFEALEGMLISNSQTLYVTQNYNYGEFGELGVAPSRLYQPTQIALPGSDEAFALASANALSQMLIDDTGSGDAVSAYYVPDDGFTADNSARSGMQVSNIEGVLGYAFNWYRVYQTKSPTTVNTNPREATPAISAKDLTIAGFNVLNLFNGDGNGGDFPTARGATTADEYARQLDKIVSALVVINADILGLMEIENDGFGSDSAIAQLVDALNSAMGEGTYAYIDASSVANNNGAVGTDEIVVGILHKPATVSVNEAPRVLYSSNSPSDDEGVLFVDTKNRPSLAQQFIHLASGETFVVNVNHFKSKGSSCGTGDDDYETGQGNCNKTRTRAATAVATWLEAEYPDTPVILLGDLNSYAKEDPITVLNDYGYSDAAATVIGELAYSYTFDGQLGTLDYLMTNALASEWLFDATEWHINADEPAVLDYNTEDNGDLFTNSLLYRASDHDPVIATFTMPSETMAGDWDSDGDIDMIDLQRLSMAIASNQDMDDSFDLNNDGLINIFDVMMLRNMCTNTGCATN